MKTSQDELLEVKVAKKLVEYSLYDAKHPSMTLGDIQTKAAEIIRLIKEGE